MYRTGVLWDLAPPFQTIKHEEHAAKRKRVANSVGKVCQINSSFHFSP